MINLDENGNNIVLKYWETEEILDCCSDINDQICETIKNDTTENKNQKDNQTNTHTTDHQNIQKKYTFISTFE